MNREDIIRMALEAGWGNLVSMPHVKALERFAALVTAAEREAWPNLDSVINWLENGCNPKDAAAELRLYAAAIRARGNT